MRIREVDFLRTIAVLLVVFFHYSSITYLNKIGYLGVDLFFILSGYLISTLLFKEYLTFGNVNAKLFLIRRGFKIYPLFYFFIFTTLVFRFFYHDEISFYNIFSELSFTRNFLGGFWVHTWSICAEEHFYFTIAIAMLFVRKDILLNTKKANFFFISFFIFGIVIELLNVALQGIYGENYFLNSWARRVQTQYCFDSLLYGVFVAYNFMFNKERLTRFFQENSIIITLVSVILVLTIPLSRNDYFAPFRDSLLSFSFGNILLLFLTEIYSFDKIRNTLVRYLLITTSKIGIYSYAIYLFHVLVRDYIVAHFTYLDKSEYSFFVYLSISIFLGVIFTKIIEIPMLNLREKYFPARAKPL